MKKPKRQTINKEENIRILKYILESPEKEIDREARQKEFQVELHVKEILPKH